MRRAEIFQSLLRGQVHTLGVGMHNFMDAKQVAQADTDPVIKARLDSCVFKGAVKRNGEWEAVPDVLDESADVGGSVRFAPGRSRAAPAAAGLRAGGKSRVAVAQRTRYNKSRTVSTARR